MISSRIRIPNIFSRIRNIGFITMYLCQTIEYRWTDPLINSDLGIIGEVSLPRAEPQTGGRSQLGGKHSTNPKCEPITIPLCTNIEYNMTIMPNLLG